MDLEDNMVVGAYMKECLIKVKLQVMEGSFIKIKYIMKVISIMDYLMD
jgi:hypothetical protein